ncbi:hypothetical protein BDM02DRAFT_3176981, partial [Thelephora ganbajun]
KRDRARVPPTVSPARTQVQQQSWTPTGTRFLCFRLCDNGELTFHLSSTIIGGDHHDKAE